MPLLFAVILSLVIIVPLLWSDRLRSTDQLRLKLYATLVIAGAGLVLYGIGTILSPDRWFARGFFRMLSIGVGLGAAGLLAATFIENNREFSQTSTPPTADQPEETEENSTSHDINSSIKDDNQT